MSSFEVKLKTQPYFLKSKKRHFEYLPCERKQNITILQVSSQLIFDLNKPDASIWFAMFQFCFNQDTFIPIFHQIYVGVILEILLLKLCFLSFVLTKLVFDNILVSITIYNIYQIVLWTSYRFLKQSLFFSLFHCYIDEYVKT